MMAHAKDRLKNTDFREVGTHLQLVKAAISAKGWMKELEWPLRRGVSTETVSATVWPRQATLKKRGGLQGASHVYY